MKSIILKKNEEKRIKSGHQWIFSNEIKDISAMLYENGVIPVEIAKNAVSLEDYYMKMVSEV